jgi:hypothetical protein
LTNVPCGCGLISALETRKIIELGKTPSTTCQSNMKEKEKIKRRMPRASLQVLIF